SASRTTSGVASTGVPTERSTMPSGCARARSANGTSVSQGKSGSPPVRRPTAAGAGSGRAVLRWQSGDDGVVVVDLPELGRATGRAEHVEELHVGLVVLAPLLRGVVLVVDRLDRADRLARTAVDALVG